MTLIGLNLIPEQVRQAQVRRQHMRFWGIVLAISGVLVLANLGVDWAHRSEAATLRRSHEERQHAADAIRQEVRKLASEANQVQLQLDRANALRSKRAWSALLAQVIAPMPSTCWLESIASDPARPSGETAGNRPSTSPAKTAEQPTKTVTIDAPRKLKLVGVAENDVHPVEYVTALKSTQLFKTVVHEKTRAETVQGQSVFRFELTCEW